MQEVIIARRVVTENVIGQKLHAVDVFVFLGVAHTKGQAQIIREIDCALRKGGPGLGFEFVLVVAADLLHVVLACRQQREQAVQATIALRHQVIHVRIEHDQPVDIDVALVVVSADHEIKKLATRRGKAQLLAELVEFLVIIARDELQREPVDVGTGLEFVLRLPRDRCQGVFPYLVVDLQHEVVDFGIGAVGIAADFLIAVVAVAAVLEGRPFVCGVVLEAGKVLVHEAVGDPRKRRAVGHLRSTLCRVQEQPGRRRRTHDVLIGMAVLEVDVEGVAGLPGEREAKGAGLVLRFLLAQEGVVHIAVGFAVLHRQTRGEGVAQGAAHEALGNIAAVFFR